MSHSGLGTAQPMASRPSCPSTEQILSPFPPTSFLHFAAAPVARLLPGAPSLFRDLGEWGAAFCSLGLRFIGRPCTWLFAQSLCLPTAWGSPAPLWGSFLPGATLFKSLMVENHHLSSPSTLLSCPRPFPHNQVSVKCQAVLIANCHL